MPANQRKLRAVLMANAIFSFTSGTLITIFHGWLAGFMAAGNPLVLLAIGIGLVLFSATVFQAAMRKSISARQVKSIIIQDWAWVAGSMAIITSKAWGLTNAAYWIIGMVALVVACFAIFQYKFMENSIKD